LKPKEKSLGAYLLARAALHRKIEGPVLENLRAGHETVQEVSDFFPLGRSNVREDLRKTKGEHTPLRTVAAYNLQKALMARQRYPRGMEVPDNDVYQTCAASGQYAKTGVCFDYATNTTPLHAAKLNGMQAMGAVVAQAKHSTIDHVWSEMLPHGMSQAGEPVLHGEDVIMDGWCKERLAVLRDDSKFARLDEHGNGDHLSHAHVLDHESGPKALAKVEMFKTQIEASRALRYAFQHRFENLVAEKVELEEKCLWDAQSVFHAEFGQQASVALHPEKPSPVDGAGTRDAGSVAIRFGHTVLLDMQAAGVARSLGSNIRGAIAEAPLIVYSAKEMFPRPQPRIKSIRSRICGFFSH
jgi:hypothetical protein